MTAVMTIEQAKDHAVEDSLRALRHSGAFDPSPLPSACRAKQPPSDADAETSPHAAMRIRYPSTP